MTSSQFTFYLNGFIESLRGQQPTPTQWETIKQTLKESLSSDEPVTTTLQRFKIEKEPLEPVAVVPSGSYSPSGWGNGACYVTGSLPNGGAVSGVVGHVLGGYIDYGNSNRGNSHQVYHPKYEEPVLNSPLDKMWLPVGLRQMRDLLNQIL